MSVMKHIAALLLAFCLLCAAASAEMPDSGAGVLEYDELTEWAQGYLDRAMGRRPLNDPQDPEALSEDGYAFVYDFATLWLDSPVMTEDSVLRAVLITAEEEAGPRGTHIDMTAQELLDSFYSENPELWGSRDSAGLYAVDLLPEGAAWAWVMRDGQQLTAVQYAVQDQLASGGDGYTDTGLVFTIQENMVAAIRAYGLDRSVSEEDVRGALSEVAEVFADQSYRQYPVSVIGTDLPALTADELAELPMLQDTPEEAESAFGAPVEDEWLEDAGAWLRVMDYGSFQLTYSYDMQKKHPALHGVEIVDPGVEGPRGVRIGDSFASVTNRFRHGENEYDPDTLTELLYGEAGGETSGMAVYGEESSAELRYTCPWQNGTAQLILSFDQLTLYDINLLLEP